MICAAAANARARRVAATLRDREPVLSVEIVPPAEGTHPQWSIDTMLKGFCDGLPLGLLDETENLTVANVQPQGPYYSALLVVHS